MEKLTLQNPITINGKKVKTLTYDTDAITVGMFADAEARKLRATSNKGGGTIRGKRLGELVRDYSRAFHTSVGELRRERLTDFLMEYYEAAEEAKRQRDKAASMPRNNFRKYRRR